MVQIIALQRTDRRDIFEYCRYKDKYQSLCTGFGHNMLSFRVRVFRFTTLYKKVYFKLLCVLICIFVMVSRHKLRSNSIIERRFG